jgi:hypothetical protein
MKQLVFKELISIVHDILHVYLTLLKIMVPALLVVKGLELMGAIELISMLLSPVMTAVGLPSTMGIVWATTMLTNIYGGMIVFFELSANESLSVAQVTVLGCMMLIAHGLPVEGAIAKKAGVTWRATLSIRIFGALIFGVLLNIIYQYFDYLQETNILLWQPELVKPTLLEWCVEQIKTLALIFLIIIALITLLRVLKWLHIETLMHWLLSPLLKLLGLSKEASNITIIGITLGLSFGGGLLIKEAESGALTSKDIFIAMSLLALCHSLIEDTLLIMLLGAHISGIFWGRLAFSIAFISIMTRLLSWKEGSPSYRFCISKIPEKNTK